MPLRLEQLVASLGAHGVTPGRIALGLAVFLISLFGSIAVAGAVLVRLPPTYFLEEANDRARAQRTGAQWLMAIAKNLLGAALVVIGIILSLPGVPGQGVLTILIGVMLLDIPGKRRLERKIVCRKSVLDAINRMRARFGREPLRV